MIIDKNAFFCNAQAETTVGTHLSDTVLDTVKLGDAIDELYFVASVHTAVTTTGGKVKIQFVTDDNAAFASPAVLWETAALEVASLGKGAQLGAVRVPKAGKLERYLGVQIVISDAVLSAGAFDAFLTKDIQTNL